MYILRCAKTAGEPGGVYGGSGLKEKDRDSRKSLSFSCAVLLFEEWIKLTFRRITDKIKWIITGKIRPIVDKWGKLHELYLYHKMCRQYVIHRLDK